MGYHTFDAEDAQRLEKAGSRYRYLSREELVEPLNVSERSAIVDLGSGTGFYTDDVAPYVDRVYAVDVQESMHEFYRDKGVPENVELVTSTVAEMPFRENQLDGAFSTMTYHEFATDDALTRIAHVLEPGSRLVIADWTADGEGAAGPPVTERFSTSEAVESITDHGFEIVSASPRPETFLVVADVIE